MANFHPNLLRNQNCHPWSVIPFNFSFCGLNLSTLYRRPPWWRCSFLARMSSSVVSVSWWGTAELLSYWELELHLTVLLTGHLVGLPASYIYNLCMITNTLIFVIKENYSCELWMIKYTYIRNLYVTFYCKIVH